MHQSLKISAVTLSAALLVSCAGSTNESSYIQSNVGTTGTVNATGTSTAGYGTTVTETSGLTTNKSTTASAKTSYTTGGKTLPDASTGFTERPTTPANSNAPRILDFIVSEQSKNVKKYGLFEVTIKLDAEYTNPFDTTQIMLDAEFTAPSGKKVIVPGFAAKEYKRTQLLTWNSYSRGYGEIKPGEEIWKIRYSSGETGTHSYKVRVVDKNGETVKTGGAFKVNTFSGSDPASVQQKGPIEISPNNSRYFRYKESKNDFMPTGYALPWSWSKTYADYQNNAIKLSATGGNFTRIWGCGLEQTMSLESRAFGPGIYHMQNAASQDLVNQLMKDYGIAVQFSFDSFTTLQSDPKWYGEWCNNPYNKAAGGFLSTPLEFFTNSEAKRLFKQRLRYTVARYGWDTNIVLWEMFNEIDGSDPFYPAISSVRKWLDEMSRYLKSIDYYKRPISVSFAKAEGFAELNDLDSIDYVICHFYSNYQGDITNEMKKNVAYQLDTYKKPAMVGEFGPQPEFFDYSANGLYLHDGIWSSIANGSFVNAQSWWWDVCIHKNAIQQHLKPLRSFLDTFQFSKEPLASFTAVTNNGKARTMGQVNAGKTRGFVFVQNTDNRWETSYASGRGGSLAGALSSVEVTIPAANGSYQVKIFDSWNSSDPTVRTVTAANGVLRVTIPSLLVGNCISFHKI